MKKIGLFLLVVLTGLSLAACDKDRVDKKDDSSTDATCESPNGVDACWNVAQEKFLWEDGAVIKLGVDNDTMGAALVEKWNADFPDLKDKLEYTYYGAANAVDGGMQGIKDLKGEAPDVAIVIDNETVGKIGSLLPLEDYFVDNVSTQTHNVVYDSINTKGDYFLPAFYDGMAFSWNKTMLEDLEIDITDADGNGLPEAFDTWEEIFAIADAWTERPVFREGTDNEVIINEVFPISLDEVWSGYSSLTVDGWELFGSGDLTDPGFDDAEFLAGLEFMKEFSTHNMSVDDTGAKKAASAMGWRWGDYLDGKTPFGLVGTWEDVDGKETANSLDFKFSTMPTYSGNTLSPLMKTKGFVINGYTENRSAASEVLRWLYTKDVMEVMINTSAYLPALEADADIYPNVESENKSEFALGMALNQLEVAGSLPNASTVRAMDVYYNIQINDYFKAVWDGTKTPAEAQTEIVTAATAWITTNNG